MVDILKRKNPSFSALLKEKRENYETVAKLSLNKVLLEKKLSPIIESTVEYISKLTNRASLILNQFLTYSLENNIQLPDFSDGKFYKRFFNVGGIGREKNDSIDHVFKTFFLNFPVLSKSKSKLCFFINYAAISLKTNFINSLWMNFFRRQKSLIYIFLAENNFPIDYLYSISCSINNTANRRKKIEIPLIALNFIEAQLLRKNTIERRRDIRKFLEENEFKDNNPLKKKIRSMIKNSGKDLDNKKEDCETYPKIILNFIEDQKKFLENGDQIINDKWLKDNLQTVLRYYFHILQKIEKFKPNLLKKQKEQKRFSFAPIHKIKRHFIKIDTMGLLSLMDGASLIKKELRPTKKNSKQTFFYESRDDHWGSTFKTDKIKTNKHKFSRLIETDGVSACIHFRHLKPPKSEKDEVVSKKKAKTKKLENLTRVINAGAERVIAIDPGRVNILYAVEKLLNGSILKYRLTRGLYYSSSGINDRIKKTKGWQKSIEAEENLFSLVSPRCSSSVQLNEFLENYIGVYDKLWQEKLMKKRARTSFRVYCLRQKTLDSFYQSMCKEGEIRPVVAYGAARFNPTGPGEIAVPTTAVAKRCCRHYRTTMIDEYCTTQVCRNCDSRLHPVNERIEGVVKSARGLKWCSSTICNSRFLDRDKNAALNILHCYRNPESRTQNMNRIYINGLSTTERAGLKKSPITIENRIIINGP